VEQFARFYAPVTTHYAPPSRFPFFQLTVYLKIWC